MKKIFLILFILSTIYAQAFHKNDFGIHDCYEVNILHSSEMLDVYDGKISEHLFLAYYQKEIYCSFSPVFFWFSWSIWRILDRPEKFLFLELLSLFLIVLSAFILFFILRSKGIDIFLSLFISLLFISCPTIFHFGIISYWAHSLYTPIFLLTLLVIIKDKKFFIPPLIFAQCSLLWEGYLFSLLYLIYITYKRDYRQQWKIIILMSLSGAFFIFHNLLKVNFLYLISTLILRGNERGLFWHGTIEKFYTIISIELGFLLIYLLLNYKKLFFDETFLFFLFPCFALFLICGHDIGYGFGRIKYTLPILYLVAQNLKTLPNRKRIIISSFLFLFSISLYFFIYFPFSLFDGTFL